MLGLEATLLTQEEAARDGVGVVRLEKLAAVGLDAGQVVVELIEMVGV